MNKNNRIVIALLVVIIALLAFMLIKSKNSVIVPESNPQTKTEDSGYKPPVVTVPTTPAKTPLSTILPTQYVGAQQGWPPVIKKSAVPYLCNINNANTESNQTIQKTINGRIYCIETFTEGAAGHIYTTYTYTTASTGGIKTTNFILSYDSCGGYDDAQNRQCSAIYRAFVGGLDAIIDSLM